MDKLRLIIREAFNTAHAISNLREDSKVWASKLTPEQIAKADKLVNDAVNQTGAWKKVHWITGVGANQANNQNNLQNYIFDKLVEGWLSTHDDKYKWAIMKFYSPALSPEISSYFFRLMSATTPVRRLVSTPEDFGDVILDPALQRIFVGTKTEPSKFEQLMNVSGSYKTIGALFNRTIQTECKGIIEYLMKSKSNTISADAPLRSTGKTKDIEDIGDENLYHDEEEDDNAFGATNNGSEEGDEEVLKTQGYEDTPEQTALNYAGEKLSTNSEEEPKKDYNAAKKLAKLYDTFDEIGAELKAAGVRGAPVIAFMESLDGMSPEEIANKNPENFTTAKDVSNALNNLVKLSPKFKSIVPNILKKNGFPENIFNDMEGKSWQKLRSAINDYKKEASWITHKPEAAPYVYQQYVGEDVSLEEIVSENFDIIMKRVKAKLALSENKKAK